MTKEPNVYAMTVQLIRNVIFVFKESVTIEIALSWTGAPGDANSAVGHD